jgi:hypothetical protein
MLHLAWHLQQSQRSGRCLKGQIICKFAFIIILNSGYVTMESMEASLFCYRKSGKFICEVLVKKARTFICKK